MLFFSIWPKRKKPVALTFKHTVYGLRFFFRLYGLEDRVLRLPTVKSDRKVPVVLSGEELKKLFAAPQRLKQRVLLALIYSAGLRVSEVCKLEKSPTSIVIGCRLEWSKSKREI